MGKISVPLPSTGLSVNQYSSSTFTPGQASETPSNLYFDLNTAATIHRLLRLYFSSTFDQLCSLFDRLGLTILRWNCVVHACHDTVNLSIQSMAASQRTAHLFQKLLPPSIITFDAPIPLSRLPYKICPSLKAYSQYYRQHVNLPYSEKNNTLFA